MNRDELSDIFFTVLVLELIILIVICVFRFYGLW